MADIGKCLTQVEVIFISYQLILKATWPSEDISAILRAHKELKIKLSFLSVFLSAVRKRLRPCLPHVYIPYLSFL